MTPLGRDKRSLFVHLPDVAVPTFSVLGQCVVMTAAGTFPNRAIEQLSAGSASEAALIISIIGGSQGSSSSRSQCWGSRPSTHHLSCHVFPDVAPESPEAVSVGGGTSHEDGSPKKDFEVIATQEAKGQ